MKRNITFDITRAIAIVLIVTCHFFMFGAIKGSYPLGRHLAGIGNNIFFALSALLFGLRYETKGQSAFAPVAFLKIRTIWLFASLWPFLTVIIILYLILNIPVICGLLRRLYFATLCMSLVQTVASWSKP